MTPPGQNLMFHELAYNKRKKITGIRLTSSITSASVFRLS